MRIQIILKKETACVDTVVLNGHQVKQKKFFLEHPVGEGLKTLKKNRKCS